MKGRALFFSAPREVALSEVDLPDPQPGDVVIRTLFSGISAGTEMLAYRGEIDPDLPLDETIPSLSGTFSYPFRYGYSCVGTVSHSSGSIAENALVFVFHPHQDVVVTHSSTVLPLRGIDARSATLLPLVETATQLSLDAGTLPDEPVVVVGLGAVGLLTALLLQRARAEVICSEPKAWRRDVASGLGLTALSPDELNEAVMRATKGRGVPVAIELSGNPDALGATLPLLGHEGTIVVGSWFGSKPVPLPLGREFHRRRLSLVSSQVSTIPARLANRWTLERRREVVLSLLEELPLKVFATHDFPFDDARRAFEAIERAEEGLVHAALTYE